MIKNTYLLLVAIFLMSCTNRVTISNYIDEEVEIWPDYKDVTVPWNIAPLCFSIEGIDHAALIVRNKKDSLTMTTSDGSFNIPMKMWRKLTNEAKGKSLSLTICRKTEIGWEALHPFEVHISEDAIDPYLVYRRINPGYGLWNRMGIYQRCLENYEENVIYENKEGKGNCINCHSFCNGDPKRWQVHIRVKYGGTYIFNGTDQSVLNLKDKSRGKPVYANWHPNGKMVAYSTNSTFFFIHTKNTNRWEVMDDRSDVMVVDVETGELFRSPQTSSKENFETFPCFSPDGEWLYFCSALARDNVISEFDSIQYNLLRIHFDPNTRTFDNKVDTIYNARKDNGSASFPRVSPDGHWLCFTRSKYGNFSICHRDADLCLINLDPNNDKDETEGFKILTLDKANSPQVDSFHSWSQNSRWMVVASKRDDAIYTKPYFFHINADGSATKAFLLPQRDAKNRYDLEMDSYNIPELVTDKIPVERIKLEKSKATTKEQDTSVN